MVFKFNPFWASLFTQRLKAAYASLALTVYSCILIYGYCLVLFGTLDKSNSKPPSQQDNWIAIPGMSLETFQWTIILCIVSFIYELILSIILFAGATKKEASLCNLAFDLHHLLITFWFILLIWLLKYRSATATFSASFIMLFLMDMCATSNGRALAKELEDLDLSRNSNMAGLLAQAQQVLLQLHAPHAIHAA